MFFFINMVWVWAWRSFTWSVHWGSIIAATKALFRMNYKCRYIRIRTRYVEVIPPPLPLPTCRLGANSEEGNKWGGAGCDCFWIYYFSCVHSDSGISDGFRYKIQDQVIGQVYTSLECDDVNPPIWIVIAYTRQLQDIT